MPIDFLEYAAKFTKEAIESRQKVPPELRSTLDEIQNELLENPNKYPDRVIPASREGTSFVYSHPDPVIQITYEVDLKDKIIYFFHFSAPSFKVQKNLFISYNHQDEEWLKRVRNFLSGLEQQGLVKFWDDRELEAGRPWHEQILEALESANAGVLLVSQDFLNSEYITKTELPKLLDGVRDKGKSIFWIHVSPSTVFDSHKEITKFQSLQKDPKVTLAELSEVERKKTLVHISKTLAEVVSRN
jgi:mRNA-degrading endonuclease RelE of RelBE toxin-antitoxin system